MSHSLRPISARSAIVTVLLCADEPSLSSREICETATFVGYAEQTARVAASRMVASGEMIRDGRAYALSDRFDRERDRLAAMVAPRVRAWDGEWELVVITAVGREPAERAALRQQLGDLGLAELREGVWLRPDNLTRAWPTELDEVCRRLVTRPVEDAAELTAALWDLTGWAETGRGLLEATASDDPVERFAAVTRVAYHLFTDPHLPTDLLPVHWPGDALRAAFVEGRAWLNAAR